MRSQLPSALLLSVVIQACVPSSSGNERTTVGVSQGLAVAGDKQADVDDPQKATWPTGRLPKDVKPESYQVELGIAPEAERFSGRVQIAVNLREPRQRIYLHGAGLSVSESYAEVSGRRYPARYRQLNGDGLSALDFQRPLPAGAALLSIRYQAPFDTTLKGLYRVDHGGASYVFTQFEPYSARQAFPCFDEPAFKTPFELVLTVPQDTVAIANTPQVEEQPIEGGYRRIGFQTTKPLPTYLVALAVGTFDVVEAPPLPSNGVRKHTIPFRGIAPRGQGEKLAYALAETGAVVAELERYFQIPYPYEKLDLIAVPDFAAGAMENAGAITFRDVLLLLDPVTAPELQRRAFAYVLAHELAHQWFGNLVTMPWWDDIWLNEAFATWMGYAVVDRLWPEQRGNLQLLAASQLAMSEDSLASARMIRQPIDTTHDITSAFDAITYSKGGAVLGMFERYLGAEVFRRGVVRYLTAHRFGSATADDLLSALSAEAQQELSAPLNSFLRQTGVPLLQVQVSCEGGSGAVTLSQSRYLPVGSTAEANRQWQVPVCLRYGGAHGVQTQCTLLSEPKAEVALQECPRWVMPNADAAGYYIWSLDADALAQLRDHGLSQLSVAEQVSLAKSLSAAISAATLPVAQVLPAFASLAGSTEREVVSAPLSQLGFIHEQLLSGEDRAQFEAFLRRLYRPTVDRLGIARRADETADDGLLRAEALTFLVDVAQDPDVRARLRALGRKALLEPDAAQPGVSSDVQALGLRVALQDGDAALFDLAFRRFTVEDDPMERTYLLSALSAVRDERSAHALSLTLSPAVRINEVSVILTAQLQDELTREAAFAFIESHFDELKKRMSSAQLGRLPLMTVGFCSSAQVKRLERVFGPRADSLAGGPRALAAAVEGLNVCTAKVATQKASAERFISGLAVAQAAR